VFRFLPYILKTLWRHRTRTMLTVSGTAVALFVFSFVTAVQEGLSRLLDDREQNRTLIVFQANRFCPSTSKLPEDYIRRIERLPGVKNAVPIKVYMNNCRASLDVVVFNGLPPDKLREIRDVELLQGDWSTFEKQQDAAIVGQGVAERRKLALGQKFSIGMLTVTVTGIFRSPDQSTENMIFTHLDFLQRTKGLNSVGTVTQLEVQLAEDADPRATSLAIDNAFRSGPIATNTRTKGVFQASAVGDLVELVGFTQYLGLACVGLVLGLVATTTVMGVQDRVKEHAVMQTIGFTGWHIFTFVIAESVLVSLAGGVVGVGAAFIILSTRNMALGTEGILITFQPSTSLVLTGVAAAAVVGLLAGIIPAIQAARAEIVPALRFG
jgi:putative ABC transport system permease protein